MSKSATLGETLDRLRRKNYVSTLRVTREEFELAAVNGESSFTVKAGTASELVEQVASRLEGKETIEPSKDALAFIDYAVSIGSGARFLALDANGDAVIHEDLDVPVFQRQRAAAKRNGAACGAVAVYDRVSGVVEPIS
jgi:hypothetical protein